MQTLVADASALVSLGIVTEADPDPFGICLAQYEVVIPSTIIEELQVIASYDDQHARAATIVLNRSEDFETRSVSLDDAFPLDEGENAAVTLANERDAALFLCDEFNQLGLIHASLADTRLVTTPTLLSMFVRTERLSPDDASRLLDAISDARSWETNTYVQRAQTLLEDP